MAFKKAAYVIGLILSVIATVFLYLGTMMLLSQTLLVLIGAAMIAYYFIAGIVGALLVYFGTPPIRYIFFVPAVIGAIQLLFCLILIFSANKIALGAFLLVIPPILLIYKTIKDYRSGLKQSVILETEYKFFKRI